MLRTAQHRHLRVANLGADAGGRPLRGHGSCHQRTSRHTTGQPKPVWTLKQLLDHNHPWKRRGLRPYVSGSSCSSQANVKTPGDPLVEREVEPAAQAQRVLRQRWKELQPLVSFFRLGKSHKVVNVALEGQIASAQSGLPTPAYPRQPNSASADREICMTG
jgi:hypothetical protein